MPPKPKFTKEEIVDAALDIVSRDGVEAMTARVISRGISYTGGNYNLFA